LVRLRVTRRLPVLARLDDGSYLSRIGALTVRIITADITVDCANGTRYTANYRLATTLCDPRRHPAHRLIALLLRVTDLAHGGVVPVEAGLGVN